MKWWDRLRGHAGRHDDGHELVYPPQLVIEDGKPVGLRRKDGTVERPPQVPTFPRHYEDEHW